METKHALTAVLWACISSWYYGYHLSELNFPVKSITCTSTNSTSSLLPECLGISDATYGVVTALFTLGGLLGSASSSILVQRVGMVRGIRTTALVNLLAVGLMSLAPHWTILGLGRIVGGVSSGIGICLVPPYLSKLARDSPALSARSGQIGSLNQMAIVIGLCCAQVAGLLLTGQQGEVPGSWRKVTALSGIVSLAQLVTSGQILPTPVVSEPLSAPAAEDVEAPLLPSPSSAVSHDHVTVRSLLSNSAFRGPTLLCASFFVLAQFSGVNAVLFYSTPVLLPLLPTGAGVLGVGITVVNALMTIPAIFLVDRLGRKMLLLISAGSMGVLSVLLAWGLDSEHQLLSGISIVLYIAAFAIGFGPVPFLLISDLVPQPAVPAASSLSLSLSWVSTFIIAILFLPIRDWLSTPADPTEPRHEGRVFYLFAAILAFTCVLVLRGLPSSN